MLVCLATEAECGPVFRRATRWIVHLIHPEHAEPAMRFATRGADKFADAGFVADENGLAVLDVASVIPGRLLPSGVPPVAAALIVAAVIVGCASRLPLDRTCRVRNR